MIGGLRGGPALLGALAGRAARGNSRGVPILGRAGAARVTRPVRSTTIGSGPRNGLYGISGRSGNSRNAATAMSGASGYWSRARAMASAHPRAAMGIGLGVGGLGAYKMGSNRNTGGPYYY